MVKKRRSLARQPRRDLTRYDPAKGVKTIVVLEAVEKHYARAKDATKLHLAIRAKLTAQAEFVFWWDTKGPGAHRGRPGLKVTDPLPLPWSKGEDGLPDKMIVSRWRRKLNTAEGFEATYDQAILRYAKLLEFDPSATLGVGLSLATDWQTPARYLDAARLVLGEIDLDPASSPSANRRVRASAFFSPSDDGPTRDWPGRVFLNPPYTGEAARFIEHLVSQHTKGITTAAIALVNANSTDVGWFQALWDYRLCFTDHRINFIAGAGQEESGSNHGSVFAYLGPERGKFASTFRQFGTIVERVS